MHYITKNIMLLILYFRSTNVMDNMIKMMERYSNHLEEMIDERTKEIEDEKKRSEQLLYRMLPR